jgi:hypothetical protein
VKVIVSTMSDRASTEIKFNELLEDYRANILKEHLSESWDMMSDAEKSSVTKLNNFFCGLHVLVHAAETQSFLFQKWFNIYTKMAMSSTFFIPST